MLMANPNLDNFFSKVLKVIGKGENYGQQKGKKTGSNKSNRVQRGTKCRRTKKTSSNT